MDKTAEQIELINEHNRALADLLTALIMSLEQSESMLFLRELSAGLEMGSDEPSVIKISLVAVGVSQIQIKEYSDYSARIGRAFEAVHALAVEAKA